jgi:DNA-binding MarR family transcriptional regulator
VTGPTAVKMDQRMEAKGQVERRRDDRDGRLVRVNLIKKGRSLQGPVKKEVHAVAMSATAGLGGRDRTPSRARSEGCERTWAPSPSMTEAIEWRRHD